MMQDTSYTIKTMVKRCGITAHMLRYYERIGLIRPVRRGRNGHRRYSEKDEQWVMFLKWMRGTHMPIREMLRYASIREDARGRASERNQIIQDRLSAVQSQIANLQKIHTLLTQFIEGDRKMEKAHVECVYEAPSQSNVGSIAAT